MKPPAPHVMKCEVQKRNGKCHRPCYTILLIRISPNSAFFFNVQRHKEHLCLWNVLKFNFIEETKKLKMAIYAHFTL